MKLRTVLALVAVAAIGGTAAGCGTVSKINPFNKGEKNKVTASQGERIPLIALNQRLEVSEALKGQGFYLPPPSPVAAWPLPGGPPDAWIDNLDAGANLQVAWRRGFGAGSSRRHYVTAPPVAADGKVFVMDADADVSALDSKSGGRIWRVNLAQKSKRDHDGFGGGLAYADGRLYVTSGYRFVAAVDAASGKVLWRTDTDAPIHGAPVVMDRRVLAIDLNDQLLAYNAETGAEDWSYQALTEPARVLAASSPAPAGDSAIAPFASGELVAVRAANGAEGWSATLSRTSRTNALSEIRDIAGRPVVYRGSVYAGSHSGVFAAIDLRSGDPQWTLPVSSITTPWPAGDVVFVVSQAGQVICAARGTGQVYWITELNKGLKRKKRSAYFGPVLASGHLLVVSDRGQLVSLDPKSGKVERTLKLGAGALQPPIAMDGTLYVVTQDATLVAIR
jgi:outer membrane protein assembly factor BamB